MPLQFASLSWSSDSVRLGNRIRIAFADTWISGSRGYLLLIACTRRRDPAALTGQPCMGTQFGAIHRPRPADATQFDQRIYRNPPTSSTSNQFKRRMRQIPFNRPAVARGPDETSVPGQIGMRSGLPRMEPPAKYGLDGFNRHKLHALSERAQVLDEFRHERRLPNPAPVMR